MTVTLHCSCWPNLSPSPSDRARCSAPLHSPCAAVDGRGAAGLGSDPASPACPGCGAAGVAIVVVRIVNDALAWSLVTLHQIHL